MRLPFPERVPILPTVVFCLVMFALQQVEGTSLLFSACTFSFILIAAIAFNVAGGFTRPSGGWIFSFSVIAVIIGLVVKVFVGEAGQSNLLQPERTIEVYVGTISSVLLVAYLNRRFRREKGFIVRFQSNADIYRSSVACFVIGTTALLYGMFKISHVVNGSFFSAFQQLNAFLPLAIVLGVTYQIRKSGGRSSVNLVVILTFLIFFSQGVLNYSKQGMFMPVACWVLPAAAQRYKVSILQVAGITAALLFAVYYLVPYSQIGRTYIVEGQSFSKSFNTNVLLLSNLGSLRKLYLQQSNDLYDDTGVLRYYNRPEGFADRLQMITTDDAAVNITEQGMVFGLTPVIFALEDNIPHFIWPSKPTFAFNNVYAHEVGILPDEDVTTGISFSPSGEAYHLAKWPGILVLLPVLLFLDFIATDSLCGDTRDSPFGILVLIVFLHSAPEGGIVQAVGGATKGILGLYVVSFICAYVLPRASQLFSRPATRFGRAPAVVAAQPRRFIRPVSGQREV